MDQKEVERISDDTFRYILQETSQWYDKRKCVNMLKVLYRDHIMNANDLDRASKTKDLMELLNSSGHLSPTNLTILYDTIKVTEQLGLEDEIKRKLPSFPNLRDIKISAFSIHRQKLMHLGMRLIQEDIGKIDGLYNSPLLEYANSWNLITDLEHKGKIRDNDKEMQLFIEKLKELKLHQAAETLQSAPQEVSTATEFRPTLAVAAYSMIDENEEQTKKEVQSPSGTVPKGVSTANRVRPTSEVVAHSKNDNKIVEENTKDHPLGDTDPEAVIALDIDRIDEAKQRRLLASWKKMAVLIVIMVVVIGVLIAVGLKVFSKSQPQHQPTIIPDDLRNILNTVENEMRLNGTTMDLSLIDLSNVKGSTLAELINMFPEVTFFNMYSCQLTGKIISDMLNEINKQGIILKENLLGLWSNNLSDIDGKSLSKLVNVLKQFSDNTFLKWSDYNLTSGNLQDLVNSSGDIKFKWSTLDLSETNLGAINGATLARLFKLFPNLKFLNMYRSKVSGTIITDMLNECNRLGITLKEDALGLWSNNLSVIEGETLADLITVLKRFDNDTALKWSDYNLSVNNLKDLLYSSNANANFKWNNVDLSLVNLASISGITLAIFQLFPNLEFLNMYRCNLSGTIISDMLNECDRLGITLKEDVLGLWSNDLSNIDGESLAELLNVLKRFDKDTALKWSDYNLSIGNLQDIFNASGKTFKWTNFDLSLINLTTISGTTLAKVFQLFPNLEFLNMYNCSLSGVVISEMLNECYKLGIILKEDVLGLWSNDLSDISGESLTMLLNVLKRFDNDTDLKWSDYNLSVSNLQDLVNSSGENGSRFKWRRVDLSYINLSSTNGTTLGILFKIFPYLYYLDMSNCNLTNMIVDDMLKECDRQGIVLRGKTINIIHNGLSNHYKDSLATIII